MEKIVEKLTLVITAPLNYDSEQRSVVQYGLYSLIQMAAIAILITIIGVLTGSLYECWIIYLCAGILRKSTGGAHAKTSNRCLVVSVIAVSVLGLLSRYFTIMPNSYILSIFIFIICYTVSCVLIYKYAPVGHPNKPLNSETKKRKLRRQSFVTLVFYEAATLLLLFLSAFNYFNRSVNFALSLCFATLWQSLTLLKAAIKCGGCS